MADDLDIKFKSTDFFPGTFIEGNIIINVRKPRYYATITINLNGWAKAEWYIERRDRYEHTIIHNYYRNTVNIVNDKMVVWSNTASPTGDLPVGSNSIPFKFPIPSGIPPSFSGKHGHVRYNIHVAADRHGLHAPDLTTNILINIKNGDDLWKLNKQPKSFEVEKKLCCFCHCLGSVQLTCSIPCTGFTPGEAISINMQVENNTSRTATIRATLTRIDRYIAERNVRRKVVVTQMAKRQSPPMQPRQVTTFEMNDLEVPSDAPITIRNCPCLFVEYTLAITVAVPWSLNKTMKLPIVVAFQPPPPQQLQQRLTTQQAVGLLCSLIKQSMQAGHQQAGHEPQQ